MTNRVSTKFQYDSSLNRIHTAYQRMFNAQQSVVTGKKQDLVVNDPGGASFIVRASTLKTSVEQYQKNLRSAEQTLKQSESVYTEMKTMLQEAYGLALQSANTTLDQTGRNAMAKQVETMMTRLVDLGNTQSASGDYIFAGKKIDTKPYSVTGAGIVYSGDAGQRVVESGPGSTLSITVGDSATFSQAYQALNDMKNHLLSGNISLLGGQSVGDLQKSMDATKLLVGDIGARMQQVQEQNNQHQRRVDDLTQRISDVEDVDMAEAISEYQLAQTVYQAALQTTSIMDRMSLMDFMR